MPGHPNSTSPAASDSGGSPLEMNWSPLELYLEEGGSGPNPVHPPLPASSAASSVAAAENAEVVEIEAPVSAPPPSDPNAGVDPIAYASLLKQKLDLYCAAVAMSRSPSADLQSSVSIVDTRPQTSGSPQHQSPTNLKGCGSTAVPASTMLQNSVVHGRTIASVPSTVISDDDELDGEAEITENVDVAHMKRVKRILSNRESARRSRKRKQVHVNELEAQVSQLRVENSSLLKRLSNMTQKYNEAVAHNTTLKEDVEILRAQAVHHLTCALRCIFCLTRLHKPHERGGHVISSCANFHIWCKEKSSITVSNQSEAILFKHIITDQVKIAKDTVKRVTGKRPAYPAHCSSTITTPLIGISLSDETSDSLTSVPDKSTHFTQASADDEMVNTCLLEIASALPVEDITLQTASNGKMCQPGSIRRVASLEHLQKRICSGPRSYSSLHLDAADV